MGEINLNVNRKRFWIAYAAVLAVSFFAVFLIGHRLESKVWKPFETLTREDIDSVGVYNETGDQTAELTAAEIDELTEILRKITLYGKPMNIHSVKLREAVNGVYALKIRFSDGTIKNTSFGDGDEEIAIYYFIFNPFDKFEERLYKAKMGGLNMYAQFLYDIRDVHFGDDWKNKWYTGR